MQLGVNFCHDARQPIGFNRDALLALRPPVVRFAVTADHVANLLPWIRSAEDERLQVLWCIPESLSLSTAHTVARAIVNHGLHVTAGLEIGFAPWAFNRAPWEFVWFASSVASMIQAPLFSRGYRPLLLGLGFDGSAESAAWFRTFLKMPSVAIVREYFQGVGVNATQPGRPLRRFLFRAVQARLMDQLGLPVAFTRVGWQLGQPLTPWHAWQELLRSVWYLEETHPTSVTVDVRRRWLLEAYETAEQLGATHFLLEPPLPGPAGVNRWPLFDPQTARVDHVWHTLQWHAARRVQPREAV